MTIDNDVNEFLEHFGVKGMRWGVRNTRSVDVAKQNRRKKIAKTTAVVAGVGGAALAGAILGRRGMVPVGQAKAFANDKAARVLIDMGSRYAKGAINTQLLLNDARHVREGLKWEY